MHRGAFAVFFILTAMLAGPALGQTRQQNADHCRDNNPDLSIGGCTALIQSGHETNEALAVAFNNRGNAYLNKGDSNRAMADLNQAIKLNPKYALAHYNRAIGHERMQQRELALRDYDQAIKLNPRYTGPTSIAARSMTIFASTPRRSRITTARSNWIEIRHGIQ